MIEIIRIYDGDSFKDFAAAAYDRFEVSAAPGAEYCCKGNDPDRCSLVFCRASHQAETHAAVQDTRWTVTCTDQNGNAHTEEAAFGSSYLLSARHGQLAMLFCFDPQHRQKAAFKNGAVTVGRFPDNDIVLDDPDISRHHARFELRENDGAQCFVTDPGSSNGTYLNGKRIGPDVPALVEAGDIVSLGCHHFTFDGSRIVSAIPDSVLAEQLAADLSRRPRFRRSPRLSAVPQPKRIRIDPPAGIGADPHFYLSLSTIGMAASGLRFVTGKLLYRKKYKLLLEKYNEYLDSLRREMDDYIEDRRRILLGEYPEAAELVRFASARDRRLWERGTRDEDFMSLRLGLGTASSELQVDAPAAQFALVKDPLTEAARELAKARESMADVPISCALGKGRILGIFGESSITHRVLKNLILQAAGLHSYDELKLVLLCPEQDLDEWAFARWLPHMFTDDRQMRFMACTRGDAAELSRYFEELLRRRADALRDSSYADPPHLQPFYLFIVTDRSLADRLPLMKYLLDNREGMGIGVIFLADSLAELPKECGQLIEAVPNADADPYAPSGQNAAEDRSSGNEQPSRPPCQFYHREDTLTRTSFTPDEVPEEDYELFTRALAPVRLESSLAGANAFPSALGFLGGYGVKRPNQLPVKENWSRHDADNDMAVPIGVLESREPFFFDIMSGHHGPHGVVVGTTGSGKTEAIQAWILSMCVRFSPEEISFVLIDFKGTGLIDPFRKLPHLAGTISNLDAGISRNLIALASELERRQKLFSDLGVNKISKYNKIAAKRLPYLFVIFDEFADFKRNYPDEMQTISRFFEQGRSLGMWFILMSQKPDPLSSFLPNAEFKWCLRVKEPEASKAMLGTSDAARRGLPPGRTFITAGNGAVYAEVQTFFSGAPYQPYRRHAVLEVAPVALVDLAGRRTALEEEQTISAVRSGRTEIDEVVAYIAACAKELGISDSPKIWNDPLPSQIMLDEVLGPSFDGSSWPASAGADMLTDARSDSPETGFSPAVGLVDDPARQSRYPFRVDFENDGCVAVLGAPGSGKTYFLETLVMSSAMQYAPDRVHIYLMDFGGGSLNVFSGLPHVGGIAMEDDAEKIKKLTGMLNDLVTERKRKFAAAGVTNILDYREVTGEQLPYTLLLIDRIDAFLQTCPDMDRFVLGLSSGGGNYGVYMAVTAPGMSGLGYKVGQNFKTKVALHLNDPSDYTLIVGKTGGLIPEDLPGRGLVSIDNNVMEMQTVRPWKGGRASELIRGIREQCTLMEHAWKGSRAPRIPVMPEEIAYGSLSAPGPVLGLSYTEMAPVWLDTGSRHGVLISAASADAGARMFTVILRQMTQRGAMLTVFGPADGRAGDYDEAERVCTDAEEMDEFLTELSAELKERKQIHDAGSEDYPEFVLAVEDFPDCFDRISNQSAKRLEMLLRLGSGLKVYLVCAGEAKRLSRLQAAGEPITSLLVSSGYGIVLGDSLAAHGAFASVKMPFTQKNEALAASDAYLICDGSAVRLKCMKAE